MWNLTKYSALGGCLDQTSTDRTATRCEIYNYACAAEIAARDPRKQGFKKVTTYLAQGITGWTLKIQN